MLGKSILQNEFIERYEDRWNWMNLSKNTALPWSLQLIECYEDRWCWTNLSENGTVVQYLMRPADIIEIMTQHIIELEVMRGMKEDAIDETDIDETDIVFEALLDECFTKTSPSGLNLVNLDTFKCF